MSTQLFDQWLEANRAALAPVARFQEIAAEATQKLVSHNLAVAQDYVAFGTRQFQIFGEVKDPQKLVAEEGQVAAEFGQKLVDRTGDFFKVAKETQDAFGAWAQSAAKTAADAFAAKAGPGAFTANPV